MNYFFGASDVKHAYKRLFPAAIVAGNSLVKTGVFSFIQILVNMATVKMSIFSTVSMHFITNRKFTPNRANYFWYSVIK